MPALPVIAGTWRVTMNWPSIGGVAPRNVFHISTSSTDVSHIVDAINTAFVAAPDMAACVASVYTCTSIDLLPLDGHTATSTHELPDGLGGESSTAFVPQVAGLVSLHTAQRGPRGRGRQYMGPVGEGAITEGILEASPQAAMQSDWEQFITTLGEQSPAVVLVVASYTHADAHVVTSVHIDTVLATQRRRQDQLR
jgi:hypothetical protein